jgi:glyoxylase-like metal-dependent hydrolase (beta-lactamase superfamily II)
VEEITEGVWLATSRRERTTSTLVVHRERALLVDPAWEPDELERIAELLANRNLRVTAGFATHAHHDHVLWHPAFGAAPRWASARTRAIAARDHAVLVANLGEHWPAELAGLVGQLRPLPDTQVPWSEPVQAIVHDGHAPGHTALWLPERRVLIAGDMLSDVELPLPFEPDDLGAYLAGLDRLAPFVARASWLIPGHGHPTAQPTERLAADRRYLDAVLAGTEPADPRRAAPGMAEVHARIRLLAARFTDRAG